MNTPQRLTLSAIVLALAAGCSSLPADNARLDEARSNYRAAQGDPQTVALAPVELKQAGEALDRANAAFTKPETVAVVDQLAYLARQRVALAQETAVRKTAEASIAKANTERDRYRLAARTQEADAAQTSAAASQRQAAASQRQTGMTEERNRLLEEQLVALNAKKTERGMVITIGDVLFATDRAALKSGGQRGMEKLASFMKAYPQRRAMIEGFTDSRGSEEHNQSLSDRRAQSVRSTLETMGVSGDRLDTHGYGEAYPVAGNGSSGGRQMNRRVEIVLSDDTGNITPR